MYVRRILITVCLVTIVGLATPAKASADWLFTPFIGVNWGASVTFNEFLGDFEDELEKRVNFGASLAWMGGGVAGFEIDFGYSPNFFEPTEGDFDFDFGDSNLTTLMANVVIGAPIGGQTGPGLRVYGSGGIGLMRSHVDAFGEFFEASSNDLGFNAGAGITGFFSDNIGLRGDVRYFRSLEDDEPDDELDIAFGDLRFWRGSVGVTFRF